MSMYLYCIQVNSADGGIIRDEQETIQIETESVKLDHVLTSLYGISSIFHKIGEMAELQRIMVERFNIAFDIKYRIDQYTEEALQNIEKGKQELTQALTYQADTRALMIKV
eukprot:TRINITY_DN105218_c0_g1_i1.p3 TRINITY_DN105218_c0_g1~~TRINITY_DN105218_c0_g1_i1.p3  ORF type:complete len:111 (-),score=10.56 TRINITY_DN105218_c0_g1_i1:190-522(-)